VEGGLGFKKRVKKEGREGGWVLAGKR